MSADTMDRLIAEGLVPLKEAANAVGIRVTSRALRGWCSVGVRGVVLESVRVGGRVQTSVEAMRRFLRRGDWN